MTSLLMGPQGAANRILSEASLSLSHTHSCHTGMTSSLPHSRFHLAAPIPVSVILTPYLPPHLPCCHTHVRLHCLPRESFSFQRGDEPTAAAVRSQACWLQLSAAHWFQQSVSILHPLEPARNHHWAKDYGKGH